MSYPEPLRQVLSIHDVKYASTLTEEVCVRIAKLANLKIEFKGPSTPGEQLLKYLDRRGCTLEQYRAYLSNANTFTYFSPHSTCYSPQSKVAILIANDKYEHLSKLASPSLDCERLGNILIELGFVTVFVKNTKSDILKDILTKTIQLIPEDSYCLLFYAGHGCELINTKCILNVDCPTDNIEFGHCVTENWLLRETAKCMPDLCVLIMDMCRVNLDRDMNPQMYAAIPNTEEYTIHNNLLISYATQALTGAYECVFIEREDTIGNTTYSLESGDIVCGGISQYVEALCSQLPKNVDLSTLLDKVHGAVEKSPKKQVPIKVQCGTSKRFLRAPVKGNQKDLLTILREALEQYKENCTCVFSEIENGALYFQ